MQAVDETFSRIPATWRSLLALAAAAFVGATAMAMFQGFIGIPAQIEKIQDTQRVEHRTLTSDIATNRSEISALKSTASAVDLPRLIDAVEELSFQVCVDRKDRAGPLTPTATRECRRESASLLR